MMLWAFLVSTLAALLTASAFLALAAAFLQFTPQNRPEIFFALYATPQFSQIFGIGWYTLLIILSFVPFCPPRILDDGTAVGTYIFPLAIHIDHDQGERSS